MRVLLLVSNAHPESIKNGMFHTAESGVAELWSDLRDATLFSANDATLGSPEHLREHCLDVAYDGPYCLGFACYWSFPTFDPKHLRDLFGSEREPPGFQGSKARFTKLLSDWRPTAVVSLNGEVYERLTGVRMHGYTQRLQADVIKHEYRVRDHTCTLFQTFPAAWRYNREAKRLRHEALLRIRVALTPTAGALR